MFFLKKIIEQDVAYRLPFLNLVLIPGSFK